MILWHPLATKAELPNAGRFLDGPYRIVLHSTEGATYAGALAAYKASRICPHFTASFEGGKFQCHQHVPIDMAASALEHRANTVETNRQSAVQIEVVAYAAHPDWPTGLVTGVTSLIAWIAAQTGVKAHAPVFLPYPASYGPTAVRLTPAAWLAFDGVCGHMHVPNQSHGDPGAINVGALLAGILPPAPKEVKPMYDPPLGPLAAVWQDPDGKVIAGISPNGDIFAWGCKWAGNVDGKPYWGTRKAAAIGPRDDGATFGYKVTATDGATYTLPDGIDTF